MRDKQGCVTRGMRKHVAERYALTQKGPGLLRGQLTGFKWYQVLHRSEYLGHRVIGQLAIVLLYVGKSGSRVRVAQEARDRANALGTLVDAHSGRMAHGMAVDHALLP